MITATTTLMRMRMILQDGNSPVALRVVAGRVEERDADHRHRRGDRQRRDPPGNYQGRCRKSWTKVGFWEIDLRRNPMRPAQPRIIWKIADTAIAPWISRILTWAQLLVFFFSACGGVVQKRPNLPYLGPCCKFTFNGPTFVVRGHISNLKKKTFPTKRAFSTL